MMALRIPPTRPSAPSTAAGSANLSGRVVVAHPQKVVRHDLAAGNGSVLIGPRPPHANTAASWLIARSARWPDGFHHQTPVHPFRLRS